MRRGASLDLRDLRRAPARFPRSICCSASGQFCGALLVEKNAIFAAIQFQRRLTQHILVLPQFAFEFVRAADEAFLLGFQLVHRLRFAATPAAKFRRRSLRQPLGFRSSSLRFAGQHLAQQCRASARGFRRSGAPWKPAASAKRAAFPPRRKCRSRARDSRLEDSSLASDRRRLVLNLVIPAASSMMARRSVGLELRIWPMRPCSIIA